MIQKLFNEIEKLKTEIRRLRGEMQRISIGGNIITPNVPGTSQMPSPVLGAIIVGNATPGWERLPIGSEGEVLTVTSGMPSWEPESQDDVFVINMAAAL